MVEQLIKRPAIRKQMCGVAHHAESAKPRCRKRRFDGRHCGLDQRRAVAGNNLKINVVVARIDR